MCPQGGCTPSTQPATSPRAQDYLRGMVWLPNVVFPHLVPGGPQPPPQPWQLRPRAWVQNLPRLFVEHLKIWGGWVRVWLLGTRGGQPPCLMVVVGGPTWCQRGREGVGPETGRGWPKGMAILPDPCLSRPAQGGGHALGPPRGVVGARGPALVVGIADLGQGGGGWGVGVLGWPDLGGWGAGVAALGLGRGAGLPGARILPNHPGGGPSMGAWWREGGGGKPSRQNTARAWRQPPPSPATLLQLQLLGLGALFGGGLEGGS